MLAILQQISSIKREEPSIASSSPEDAAPVESIASSIIKYHPLKIVRALIRLKIYSDEPDLVLSDKI
jgi:hypothetical protein